MIELPQGSSLDLHYIFPMGGPSMLVRLSEIVRTDDPMREVIRLYTVRYGVAIVMEPPVRLGRMYVPDEILNPPL
jgi:hypothetical protein